ncbi:MAG: peptidylprolyl isomerase, partial [Proteobacteria bacterium]|nr:peptidylprolyl isomerase [Pseudomonadota bacterium]
LLPALEQEAFGMKPGEVSPIIKTAVGLHIIKVIDKQGGGSSEVQGWQGKKEEIEEGLYRQEVENLYQKWMEDLKKKAYIKNYL